MFTLSPFFYGKNGEGWGQTQAWLLLLIGAAWCCSWWQWLLQLLRCCLDHLHPSLLLPLSCWIGGPFPSRQQSPALLTGLGSSPELVPQSWAEMTKMAWRMVRGGSSRSTGQADRSWASGSVLIFLHVPHLPLCPILPQASLLSLRTVISNWNCCFTWHNLWLIKSYRRKIKCSGVNMVNVTEELQLRICCLIKKKSQTVCITQHWSIPQVSCLPASPRHVLTSY